LYLDNVYIRHLLDLVEPSMADTPLSQIAALANQIVALTNTLPPNPPTDPPPVGDDGVQAAVVNKWGAVIDGDEFEYSGAPKSSLWGVYNGPGHNNNGRRVPSAFTVANGVLTCHGDTAGNSGGMAFARGRRYTRIEVRARVYATGDGSGSQYHAVLLLWPDAENWPRGGEYDYFETNVGDSGTQAFMHKPGNDGNAQSSASLAVDITQWHNYAFEWLPGGRVTGWCDGKQWFSFAGSQYEAPGSMHPTIQLDNFGGSPHKGANFDVKWVRIYAV
jgi:hypothetical protein